MIKKVKEQDEWNTLTEEENEILKEGNPEECPVGLCPTKEELLKAEGEVNALNNAWNSQENNLDLGKELSGLRTALRCVVSKIGNDLNEEQLNRLDELHDNLKPTKEQYDKAMEELKRIGEELKLPTINVDNSNINSFKVKRIKDVKVIEKQKESIREKVERIQKQEFDKLSAKEKQRKKDEENEIYETLDKFFGEENARN